MTNEKKENLVKLYQQKKSIYKVAKELGISSTGALYTLKKQGINRRGFMRNLFKGGTN